MKPFWHLRATASAAGVAMVALASLPLPAAADNLSSFVAGVATGMVLGGGANSFQQPAPSPYYYQPQPPPTYYYPRTQYVYVQPPPPRYVYVVPGWKEHHDNGRWHRWRDGGED